MKIQINHSFLQTKRSFDAVNPSHAGTSMYNLPFQIPPYSGLVEWNKNLESNNYFWLSPLLQQRIHQFIPPHTFATNKDSRDSTIS